MALNTTDIRLDGQTALVTGGGRGLGRAMALALAQRGAAVAVTARSEDQISETVKLIEAAGGRALGITADVTDFASVTQMVETVESQLGAIDLLVNNAGHGSEPAPVAEADPDSWWWTFEVNVRGVFLCARAVLPAMIQRKRGCIINVASGAGNRTIPNATAYTTSKAAVMRFSDTLAVEVQEHGISVFVIHPGTVWTEMTRQMVEGEAGKKWLPWFRNTFDQGKDDAPESSADLVVYLASGKADALSGRFITVSDDLEAMIQDAEKITREDLHVLRLRR